MHWLLALLTPLLLVIGSPVYAQDAARSLTEIYFAGIAFTGDKAAAELSFPHSDALLSAAGEIGILNAALLADLEHSPPANFKLRSDLANLDGSTSAVAVAASIDRETVVVEQIGERYKVLVEIAANALFFDFREKVVLASRPVTLQRIDIADSEPDTARIRETVRHLLTSPEADGFVVNLAEAIREAVLPQASSRRIQVSSVDLSEQAQLELTGEGRNAAVLQATLANELTKLLGDRQHISLLPYQKGQAIGGAMSARFADGRVYMLTIPAPDYSITVQVDNLKNKVAQETAVARNLLYGAYFTVSVIEPLSSRVYFSRALRQGSTRLVPLTQTHVDHAAAHYENLLVGFDAFAKAIDDPSSSWAKQQTDPGSLKKHLKTLAELVRTCR